MNADKLASIIKNAAGEYEACGHGNGKDVVHGCQLFALALQAYLSQTLADYKNLDIQTSSKFVLEEVMRFVGKVNKGLTPSGNGSSKKL